MEMISDQSKNKIEFRPFLWVGTVLGSILLGAVCFFWSIFSDFWVAEVSGEIIKPPPPAWTTFSTPDYMFGSIFGPAMSLHLFFFFGGCIIAGLLPSLIIIRSIERKKLYFGRYSWLLIITVILWLVKLPIPGDWTLYYHFAVRY
jgi:hypothetical protein